MGKKTETWSCALFGRQALGALMAFFSCLLALATPATAACVAPGDLARGIVFQREIKGTGTAIQNGQNVQVNYRAGSSSGSDMVVAKYGIYPKRGAAHDAPPGVIGAWFNSTSTYAFSGNPPAPQPGRSWQSTLTIRSKGDDQSGAFKSTQRYTVTYQYEQPRQATLSGCTYSVLGVTARFTGEGRDWTDRYAYFPDLGFGVVTQYTNNQTGKSARYGITRMTPR